MKLFAIFHLNLMFSSIEEESRVEVINNCYRPLLDLVEKHGFPLGIEASGITLEIISALAPDWMDRFRILLESGQTEFIGSGYGQIIGPLVPPSVNRANLRIGMRSCEKILGLHPRIALINEQAWSAGLVSHYLEAGFEAIFMDYDNPARFADWPEHIQHFPQRAQGVADESIPLIWSRSMVFQKLQRLAHGELELPEYLDYVQNLGTKDGWLPIYGNDAEIFDYRPGRYHTEAGFTADSEWQYILTAFNALRRNGHDFHLPSSVLDDLERPEAGNRLALCTAGQPVPVKKQNKYNLTRWAVSGRDDFQLNSLCRAVAARLEEQEQKKETEEKWRQLCFCWSSDFRTHITGKRFSNVRQQLHCLAQQVGAVLKEADFEIKGEPIRTDSRFLEVRTAAGSMQLNCAKGLAIGKASFPAHDGLSVFGTLDHGYFSDIALGADFYSGHLIMEGPGNPKETDLCRVVPHRVETDEFIQICAGMEIQRGRINKAVRVHKHEQRIDLLYRFRFNSRPRGYVRLGHFTLLTENLDPGSLFYRTANGGKPESFPLTGSSFDHGRNVSFLVSSSQAAGMTESSLVIGDARMAIEISPLINEHAYIALITCLQAEPSPFVRVAFSMQEMDETLTRENCAEKEFIFSTGFSIKPFYKAENVSCSTTNQS